MNYSKNFIRLSMLVGAVSCFSYSIAQVSLDSRHSTLNYSYVYGAGADTWSGGNTILDGSSLLSDTEQTTFAGSTSGGLPNGDPYSGQVSIDISHNYALGGTLTDINLISGHAESHLFGGHSGAGVGLMRSESPGNGLEIRFNVATATNYAFTGTLDYAGVNILPGEVSLQMWDGFTWQYHTTTLFLTNSKGTATSTGILNAGLYRVLSNLNSASTDGIADDRTLNYELALVPEPSSFAVIGLGIAALLRRKKK